MVVRKASSPLTSELDALVQQQMDKWKVPGLTMAIVHGSSTWSKVDIPGQLTDPCSPILRHMAWLNSLVGK
jgi:hypothetical protein